MCFLSKIVMLPVQHGKQCPRLLTKRILKYISNAFIYYLLGVHNLLTRSIIYWQLLLSILLAENNAFFSDILQVS